jgi:2',3'-cyclic-nucleotide 2'-phosphodiesterase (5'-nucleotidase family)
MRDAFPGARAAFINAGSLRLNQNLHPGQIRRRHLEELIEYDNKLGMIEIDGKTLKAVIDNAVEGWPGNGRWLQISGFTFRHSLEGGKSTARELALLGDDGQRVEIRPEERIRVVTSNFLLDPSAGDQDGYTMLKPSQVVSGSSLKNVFRDGLKAASEAIAPELQGRIVQTNVGPPCN